MHQGLAQRAGSERYTGVAKALHWLLAALIFGQIAFGWYLQSVPRKTPARTVYVNLHKSTGLTLGLLEQRLRLLLGALHATSSERGAQREAHEKNNDGAEDGAADP